MSSFLDVEKTVSPVYNYLDDDTFNFLFCLQMNEPLWYNFIIKTARGNHRSLYKAIKDVKSRFDYLKHDVDAFKIVQAVRRGMIKEWGNPSSCPA